ncbi:hypothetical protein [Campylobacter ureolyticus]|uniref:hypothetical protein n=1 Tax=Campylobacter ureolyticus TaxID=827 RepID=UPI001FC8505B|nr:hypothetical protein [Campylobacter ureolyticus]MCZ6105911.1 hypothetical protein [Campylobacter ureolyticus]MCZ6158537.1 hypothetical protein [Campylobacter ureolyticus]GKH60195.1 hypothetical protein CE91St25_05310 [Campylobacter ureolyticus]
MFENIFVVLVLIVISLIVFTIILAFIAWILATLNDFLSLFDRPYKEPKHKEPIYEEPDKNH